MLWTRVPRGVGGNRRRLAGTLFALATGSLDDFVLGGCNIGRVEDFVETFDYLNLFEGGINPFFVLPAQEPCMQTTIVDWHTRLPSFGVSWLFDTFYPYWKESVVSWVCEKKNMGGIFIRDETSADFCSGCRWLEGYTKAYSYKSEREAYKTGNVFFNSSLATATHSLHAPSMIVALSFAISLSENEIHFWRSPTYNLWWILQYNIAFPFFVININNSAYFSEIALRFIFSLRSIELVTK